jgi:hypothetical protein
MGLVTRTFEAEIPHEEGSFLTLKRLSGRERDVARTKGIESAAKTLAAVQSVTISDAQVEAARARKESGVAVYAEFDQETVVQYGLVGWRGPAYQDESGAPVPCNAQTKLQLDSETWDFAFDAIMRASIRPTERGSDSD